MTAPTAAVGSEEPCIVRHPDGLFWHNELHEVGPFATLEDACADMESAQTADEARPCRQAAIRRPLDRTQGNVSARGLWFHA